MGGSSDTSDSLRTVFRIFRCIITVCICDLFLTDFGNFGLVVIVLIVVVVSVGLN